MAVYYNEHDRNAAAWLRELMKEGCIPHGEVDERCIRDIPPIDLDGFTQHHFFAGIGGWAYALRLAGWPDDRPVWTGSCPCQPFSQAGKGRGTDDPRHLWPAFRWLIAQYQPSTIFGEQVASSSGRDWLGGVRVDLEAMGYCFGAADLCAAGINAPHIRQRLWWVADSHVRGWRQGDTSEPYQEGGGLRTHKPGDDVGLANTQRRAAKRHRQEMEETTGCDAGEVWEQRVRSESGDGIKLGGHWRDAKLHPCEDGKQRRIPSQSRLFPLAHGIPGRVALLRGSGNAIVPQVAQVFIEAFIQHQGR